MASKKKEELNKYCRIFRWIESQDPEFAEIIRDLCLERSLTPGPHQSGVTFLYPKDKAYRQEIITNAYSKDADEAVRIIESLIIPEALIHGSDFKKYPIGSKLGVKYDVESADASMVTLANGVELVPTHNFHTLASRKGKLAIWIVNKGRLPLVGKEYKPQPHKPSMKSKKRKIGGGESDEEEDIERALPYRQMLALELQVEFISCMRRNGDKCKKYNPYLAKMVSLLNYLDHNHKSVLEKVVVFLDYDPLISFYLIVEPFKTKGELLIPDNILFGPNCWNCVDCYTDAVAEYLKFFNKMANTKPTADMPRVFCLRSDLNNEINTLREKYYNNDNIFSAIEVFQKDYGNLVDNNKINNIGPVLPKSSKDALTLYKKIWQDEFRFKISSEVYALYMQHEFNEHNFITMFTTLHTQLVGNDYEKETMLTNIKELRDTVSKKSHALEYLVFVKSSDFLYLPIHSDLVGVNNGTTNPVDRNLYNRNRISLNMLKRITGMKRPDGISPAALQEIQMYIKVYKVLPPVFTEQNASTQSEAPLRQLTELRIA